VPGIQASTLLANSFSQITVGTAPTTVIPAKAGTQTTIYLVSDPNQFDVLSFGKVNWGSVSRHSSCAMSACTLDRL